MATSTTTATALHPQFRPPSHPCAPRRLRPCPSSSSSVRPRFSVRAAAASASASAPVQREAVSGVPWGCEIESLESAASLERWLTASGLPEQRLALEKVDIGERGLVALKNVRNGEKLLFVPPTLVITADSEWTNREVGDVMKRYSVPDWPLLATYLISEASLEGSSRWSSYIDALPRQPYSLLYWTRTEIDAYLVASPIRERAISRISDVIGTYNDLRDRIFSKHPDLFPEKVYNMENFRWSFGILFSRLVRLESMGGKVALVPWADMLNHSPEVDAFLDYDKSSQGIVFTTDRSYQPGEQVFISYGKKSSGELLLSYGFVPKEGTNPNDSVEFLVSLKKSDECYKEKLQALKKHGLSESESFPLRVTGWPVELMAYAFLVVSPPEMIQRFEEMAVAASNKGSSKPAVNYPELDEQALQFILDCCESSIKRYTKYLEGAKGSAEVSINTKQANRTLLLKQLARDLCISERRILYRSQYILRRRLRDMRAGGELKALSLFNGLRNLFK
ncbi:ribulose-1,5 bisphosphate carboxylase/oxygenase large subunit N-methyltransferase, chloroplastic [Hordeum vulgare subsp. vulgare]|uniref:Predicted protein n=1 Tax=Hordeum vulgare subsp. vulgare TaxID=112509 RepID=F2D654_HORVV|nr:ribulose-1,5 bisphosphate carboxylase/oxygenase large subunit N-methyltransferase, chloroplastic [Hordeum vulgare subsp. vulgare]XP_044955701.1 ribulose-1,5 bisphosphate carboxylase/oxygenase large subunit N-methyltransferase, chloroplastic [Hordeum vulgare subsp. vulgare]BAJ90575.1 predicted protein [Hordeum vulgare subsp. vulgare]